MSVKFQDIEKNTVRRPNKTTEIEKTNDQDRGQNSVAVIGVAGRFPNDSSVASFFQELIEGKDFVGAFPEKRREDIDAYEKFRTGKDEKVSYREGAYLKEISTFANEIFGISPREAQLMDPAQRICLETAWNAFDDAGYTRKQIKGSNTGVYLGAGNVEGNTYGEMIVASKPEDYDLAFAGNLPSVLAGRISYVLDLQGPSMVIDTACSSSLVAVYQACQAIRHGECEMALAGGVKLNLMPFAESFRLGIESGDRRTHAFDQQADGTGSGEGAGIVLLKSLEKAVADQDQIYAVIKGGAVNQDGHCMSVTSPNVLAQERVIRKAWEDAKINPEDLCYMEAHGTGTRLGDPIELDAITRAFRKVTEKKQLCAVGSVKTNIGHLDAAAGIAGLVKVLGIIKTGRIPPTLYFENPNRKIDFINSPVYVNDKVMRLSKKEKPILCGISAFGLSGTNCHLVVEEYRPQTIQKGGEEACKFVFAADTVECLSMYLEGMVEYLTDTDERLEDISYTLCRTRSQGVCKLVFQVKSKQEAIRKIKAALRNLKQTGSLPAACLEENEYGKFGQSVHKVSLPTMPVTKQRCWISFVEEGSQEKTVPPLYELCWRETAVSDEVAVTGFQALLFVDEESEQFGHQMAAKNGWFLEYSNRLTEDASWLSQYDIPELKKVLLLLDVKQADRSMVQEKTWWLIRLIQLFGRADSRFHGEIVVAVRTPRKAGGEFEHAASAVLRVAKQEYTELTIRMAGFDEETDDLVICRELVRKTESLLVHYEKNVPKVMEIRRLEKQDKQKTVIPQQGVFLLIGGLGGIGLCIARYLASCSPVRIILTGRQNVNLDHLESDQTASWTEEEARVIQSQINEMRESGSQVEYYQADVTSRCDMEELTRIIRQRYQKLDGIFHLAGLASGRFMADMQREDLHSVWSPKYEALEYLDSLTDVIPTGFLILFSSIAVYTGGAGQAAYASANAVMAGRLGTLRKKGKDFRVIHWPTWIQTGMARQRKTANRETELVEPLERERALQALDCILNRRSEYSIFVGNINPNLDMGKAEESLGIRFSEKKIGCNLKAGTELNVFTKTRRKMPEKVTLTGSKEDQYSEMEQGIGTIWANELGLSKIDITRDFYSLGGESILATRIVNRMNKEYGLRFNIADLFGHPTIQKLALLAQQQLQMESMTANNQTKTDSWSGQREYPLSSAQERIWFLHKLYPNMMAYQLPFEAKINAFVDFALLKQSFQTIILRHPMLQVVFRERDGKPYQVVIPQKESNIRYLDCSEEGPKKAEDILNRDRNTTFNLSKETFRVILLKLAKEEYIFYFNIHHLITDGWSTHQIYQEVVTVYNGLIKGKKEILPPIKATYFDWIKEEREWKNTKDYKEAEQYWMNELAEKPTALNLPIDFPRQVEQTYAGSYEKMTLTDEMSKVVIEAAKACNVTLNAYFMAVYYILLRKITGNTDIIIGIPKEERTKYEYEKVVGLFVNSLCIRIQAESNITFADLVTMVKEKTLLAYQYGRYPFDDLVTKRNPERNTSQNPLFSTMYQFYEDIPQENSKTTLVDISTFLRMNQGRIECRMDYNKDLFRADSIKRYLESFYQVLSTVLGNPNSTIQEISLVNQSQKDRILKEFNHTEAEYPKNKTILDLFYENVVRKPDKIVVKCEGKGITFRELEQKARLLAGTLEAKGVIPEMTVAIMAERSFEMIIGMLAIMMAGAAYLPIDGSLPLERKKYMLNDSHVSCILVSDTWLQDEVLKAQSIPVLNLKEPDNDSCTPLSQYKATATGVAYIIYTSGSTGKPKGVMIEHHSIVNRLCWMQKAYPLTEQDWILQKTNVTFDVSVWELFWYLIAGAGMCFLENGEENNPTAIVENIYENQITTMHFVPSMLAAFLEYVEVSGAVTKLHSLKRVFASGEALLPAHVKQFYEIFHQPDSAKLINLYGPTEATVDVSYYDCRKEDTSEVPIGEPIDNIKLYIVDQDGNLAPVGVEGELCIAGEGLARGYRNKEKLTQEKFEKNPFYQPDEDSVYQRLYHTGDIARWRSDGKILYKGRMDCQVKIRGFRIELAEVETALLQMSQIKEAVVLDIKDSKGMSQLIAYLAVSGIPDEQDIKKELKKKVPAYMIPAHFVFLDSIPVTKNGKADRKALRETCNLRSEEKERVGLEGSYEQWTAAAFADVLGLQGRKLEASDDFFSLGGNSIYLVQLHNKIIRTYTDRITLNDLFEHLTVRKMARFIKERCEHTKEETVQTSGMKPKHYSREEYFEVTPNQARIFSAMMLTKDRSSYHMLVVYRVKPGLDYEKAFQSFQKLIWRHDSLRMNFRWKDGKLMYQVKAWDEVTFELKKEGLAEDSLNTSIKEFVKPFNLEKDLLFRAKLLVLPQGETIVLMDMPHIISDGMTLNILLHDFMSYYQEKQLPELLYSYRDYSRWFQQEYQKCLPKEEEYWLARLDGFHTTSGFLPDREPDGMGSREGIHFTVGQELTDKIRNFCKEADGTVFLFMVAVYTLLVARESGQEDVVVGVPVSGRTSADTMGIAGLFTNTLALRSQIDKFVTFEQFLGQVKQDTLHDLENQYYQLDMLMEKVRKITGKKPEPFFSTMLLYQNFGKVDQELSDFTIEKVEELKEHVKYAVELEIFDTGEKLQLEWKYDGRLFSSKSIERYQDALIDMIQKVSVEPQYSVEMLIKKEKDTDKWEKIRNQFDREIEVDFQF